MPEGDSVRIAATRMHEGLTGRRVTASRFDVPHLATASLDGATVLDFDAVGKHMLTRFALPGPVGGSDRWTLHTHFKMDGQWTLLGAGKVLPRRLQGDVRVALETDEGTTAYGLRLPLVALLPTADEPSVVGHLGPDVLAPDFDRDEALRRLAADGDRPLVEALLDQKNLCGIGNLWANETCFLRGVSPWTPVRDVDLGAAVDLVRRMMRYSLVQPGQVTTGDTRRGRTHWVYGRSRESCYRCGTAVEARDEVDGQPYARATWWCPTCQPGPYPSLEQRPWRDGVHRGAADASWGSRVRGTERTERLRRQERYGRAAGGRTDGAGRPGRIADRGRTGVGGWTGPAGGGRRRG